MVDMRSSALSAKLSFCWNESASLCRYRGDEYIKISCRVLSLVSNASAACTACRWASALLAV